MKWALLVLIFSLATDLEAKEVIATGYGTTVEQALQNAKTLAIEQVASTFVTGNTTVVDDAYRSRIEQYHGGLIRHYRLLGVEQSEGLISARIEADVDTEKINTVIFDQGADVSSAVSDGLARSNNEFERTAKIVAALDDPTQAFVIRVAKVNYVNRGPLTDVEINAQITMNPKWYDDVKTMAKAIGRKLDLGSGWADGLWGIAALSAIVNPMIPGTINHLARAAEKKAQPSHEYAACFGQMIGRDVDECYEIRHRLPSVTGPERLKIEIFLVRGDHEEVAGWYPVNIKNQLFVEVSEGRSLYFRSSAKERRFENQSVLLFERSMMPFKYVVTLPTDTLLEAKSFRISLAPTR